MRLAFFTPLPPERSGIAHYAAELLPALLRRHAIDVYTDQPPTAGAPDGAGAFGAHDFVWKQARTPYDLVVYQLGNAPCHDYMWAYLTASPPRTSASACVGRAAARPRRHGCAAWLPASRPW